MTSHSSSPLSEAIIEALYAEALVLADEVRTAFSIHHDDNAFDPEDKVRLALSSEGLKATTRMMHVLAWLLNQRAFFSGDLSEGQLRRYGRLPDDRAVREEDLALLEPATRALIEDTVRLHRRIARLDKAWHEGFDARLSVPMLRNRLESALRKR